MKIRPWLPISAATLLVVGLLLYWRPWLEEKDVKSAIVARKAAAQQRSPHPPARPGARLLETTHYAITSSADEAQTREVAAAVEALYSAYNSFFQNSAGGTSANKLQLTLYADQAEFKANNRSSPWAEAYYLHPVCYAYYAADDSNPYHWMTHEATHQLNRELTGRRHAKWMEEGLATYFGASRITNGRLAPGTIDANAYPIWWLDRTGLSGSLDNDIRDGQWIPIRALITGVDAPSMSANVNRYYIQFWSLTHFMFHHDNGRYAKNYRQLIADGGSLENFERLIGPADKIEREWYDYLQVRIAEFKPSESR